MMESAASPAYDVVVLHDANSPLPARRRFPFGVLSLIFVAARFLAWFVPYSPAVFLFGVYGLQVIAFLSAVIAGFHNSRWWFAATVVPLLFIFGMNPQYEQMNDVSLKGDLSQGIAFKLFGVFDVPYLTIAAYSADLKEPDDERFIVWRIEPAQRNTSGEPAWEIGTLRYGHVPPGYVQTFPEHGAPSPLEANKIYVVRMWPRSRFFHVANGKPEWLKNPPLEPCFTKQHDNWIRVLSANPLNQIAQYRGFPESTSIASVVTLICRIALAEVVIC